VWTEFQPASVAPWEHQPETPVEVLLLDKIAANLFRFNRLLMFEFKYSGDSYPLDHYWLARVDSILETKLRCGVSSFRTFANWSGSSSSVRPEPTNAMLLRAAEDNAATGPDWPAVVPPDSAWKRSIGSNWNSVLRATYVETKPTSSELGKPKRRDSTESGSKRHGSSRTVSAAGSHEKRALYVVCVVN